MKSFSVDELDIGAVFDCPTYTPDGKKLSDPFSFFRSESLEQLRLWQIDTIQAESGPLTEDELEAYRSKAREMQGGEKTATADVFELDDPVEEGETPPADNVPRNVKKRVQKSYRRCLTGTKKILKPLSQGRISDAKELYDTIQPIVEVAMNMQSALLFLLADLEGDDEDDYLFPYSLHTCLISVLLALEIGYEAAECRKVGVAGLIHDVGMLKIPQHIRLATGDLDESQIDMIHSHPERGARILSNVDRLESSVQEVAAEHHEQVDGSGYPLGLTHEDIHPHSRIVNLAMTFVAMTQKRSHRSSLTAQESIRELVKTERERYDGRVLRAFINRFGLYPPGTFVRLNTGHTALVTEVNSDDPLNPTVKVLTSSDGSRLSQPFSVGLQDYDVKVTEVIKDHDLGSALELA
ncbi:MAG: HD-GYP domain-containing protein [bacterium]